LRADEFPIGALSAATGVNIETIQYYEMIGLMPAPPRNEGRQRVYDATHLKRLSFIRRGRELGFSLDQIREPLGLVDRGGHHLRPRQGNDRHARRRHPRFANRPKQIVEFALDHPTGGMALGTVAEAAERAGVQPSAIVRFARAMGYGGFTEMQQVFRSRLVASFAPSYKEPISGLRRDRRFREAKNPRAVLARLASEGTVALESLQDGVREKDLVRAVIDRNLLTTILVCQRVARIMMERRKGRIIAIGLVAGSRGRTKGSNYATAKAVVAHFTHCRADQLRPYGVTANIIAPGDTRTERFLATRAVDPRRLIEEGTLDRIASVDEVARVVELFAGPLGAFVSGQVLRVDGASQSSPA
jgi:3-oxoacyl-[acyl-carrier protein] reductase